MAYDDENRATKTTFWGQSGVPRARTLRIRGLQHYYGTGDLRKQVLFDNNLDVFSGEIVIMTGPSGSGKTTLLTLIGGLRTVQEGSLSVLGHDLKDAAPADMIATRHKIGFIFQAHNLFGSLTAMQNVTMGMELFPMKRAEMKQRAADLLTRLGLGHRLHYKPHSLSGGQKQRVAIARGLAHRPKIVLADEPTAALDEKSGREAVTVFQELALDEKVTIVMVTHDNRILDVADRVVNMVDGRVKSDVVVREAALICEFIKKLPAFRELTPATLASIADKMWAEQHSTGEIILRQGEVADKFYLVRHGAVEIQSVDEAGLQSVATLKEGACFGKRALLRGEPSPGTVRIGQEQLTLRPGQRRFSNGPRRRAVVPRRTAKGALRSAVICDAPLTSR